MKKIKKSKVLTLILALLLLFANIMPVVAAPTDKDSELLLVTDDIAIEMAERFAEDVSPDISLTADNPVKVYNNAGQAIGYIVNFYHDQIPYGYIIFDNTGSGTFSEFSIAENVKNPYEVIEERSGVSAYSTEGKEERIYKIDAVTYGISINDTEVITNYNDEIPLNTIDDYAVNSVSDSSTHEWDEVFFTSQQIRNNYNIIESNNIASFYSFNENYVESQTGRYACAVSAAITCAAAYGAIDYLHFADNYIEMWNLTSTTVDHTGANGIIYGSTYPNGTSSGVVQFCRSRNINLSAAQVGSPSYTFFKNTIDSGNVGILNCGINKVDGRAGHAMAVEGYRMLQQKNGSTKYPVLMVSDGWYDSVRYLNLNYPYWTDTNGLSFSHN